MEHRLSVEQYHRLVHNRNAVDECSVAFAQHYLIVDMVEGYGSAKSNTTQPQCPVIALATSDLEPPAFVDVVANNEQELALLTGAIDKNPLAATLLVQLLRHNERSTVEDGLLAESLSYSCLQHSNGFRQWLAQRSGVNTDEACAAAPLLLQRDTAQLHITFNRSAKRNAYNIALRDAFYQALMLADSDTGITNILIDGAGCHFCAGGDLREFGTARDGAAAHAARTTRSTALLLDRLKATTHFEVQGACIGAGIELPAFSQRISAHRDSYFQLPELAMGLIPGAGGTVSIGNRIGRHRLAFMAISNKKIDAEQALDWGLIDRVHP